MVKYSVSCNQQKPKEAENLSMTQENKSEDLERPEQIIDDIVADLDSLHGSFVNSAEQVGFTLNLFHQVRPLWEDLGKASTDNPEAAALFTSGIDVLKTFRDELHLRRDELEPALDFRDIAGTANYISSASLATGTFFQDVTHTLPPPPYHFSSPNEQRSYAKRFSKLDPELGKTYRAIGEALYSTRANPERAALYLIRQAFDHFFDKLAPDDEVRKSQYWKPKSEEGKENQVHRIERMRYAAAKHVKDKARAETLTAEATNMIKVYDTLNSAHKRGELNRERARQALITMQGFLNDWAEAVGL